MSIIMGSYQSVLTIKAEQLMMCCTMWPTDAADVYIPKNDTLYLAQSTECKVMATETYHRSSTTKSLKKLCNAAK